MADCNKWNILNWLTNDGSSPLIDIFFSASADMVDVNAQVLFEVFGCQSNYLRIQVSKHSVAHRPHASTDDPLRYCQMCVRMDACRLTS